MHAIEVLFHPDAPFLSQLREAYVGVVPRSEDRSNLVTKMRDLLASHYDWTQDIAAIQAPTLIVIGDADTIPPAHAVEPFELLGGGKAESAMGKPSKAQLSVLPGTTEFSLLARLALLLPIITPLLEGEAYAATGLEV